MAEYGLMCFPIYDGNDVNATIFIFDYFRDCCFCRFFLTGVKNFSPGTKLLADEHHVDTKRPDAQQLRHVSF